MRRAEWAGLAIAISAVGLGYDPRAEAAEPKRTLGVLFLCAALALHFARAPARRAIPRAAGFALAFVALSALSFAWGPPAGFLDLATWGGGLGVALFAHRAGRARSIRAARLVGLTMGGASALITIGAAARGLRGFALHAGQGNPNWLGLLFAVTLPLSLDAALSLARARSRLALLAAPAALIQLPALYLSHSRAAWIATGIAGALQLSLSLRLAQTPRPPRGAGRGGLGAAAMILAATLALATSSRALDTSDPVPTPEDVPAAQALRGRVWIWTQSAAAARASAPAGAGLGGFARAFLDAQGRALARLSPNQAARRFVNATTAHDDYLQVAVESGPLAAILLVAALVTGVRAHLRARWIGGASALVGCAIAAIADSPLRQPAVVLLVGLLFGALPARRAAPLVPRGIARALDALVLLGAASLLQSSVRAWLSTRAQIVAASSLPDVRIDRFARARRLDPTSGEAALNLGLARLSDGDARRALVDLAAAQDLFANVGTAVAIGHAHLALEDPEPAACAYRAALAWCPGSLRAHVGLAESLRAADDLDGAEAEARVAEKLAPSDPRVQELASRIREARMDAPRGREAPRLGTSPGESR